MIIFIACTTVVLQCHHRRSQGGAVGAPAPPRAVKKFFSGLIYRENV